MAPDTSNLTKRHVSGRRRCAPLSPYQPAISQLPDLRNPPRGATRSRIAGGAARCFPRTTALHSQVAMSLPACWTLFGRGLWRC
jgi:hypothetical protein